MLSKANRICTSFNWIFTLIVTTLFFQDYEYIRYIKGAGLICWVVSTFLIPEYEPTSKGR